MKNIAFGLLILLLLIQASRPNQEKEYFIGFFGEGINLNAPVGHAFIGIGRGIPLTCNLNGDETIMMGFYPKVRIEGGKSFWFGAVPGAIKNDVRSHIDCFVYMKIDFADYIKVNLKIEEWKKKKYELLRKDCISFFIDVAQIFPDIKLPDRAKYVLPNDYVKQFILLNNTLH